MGFYRKKPVVIEAIQWTGDNFDEIKEFCGDDAYIGHLDRLYIKTLEGDHQARWTDFIIKGVQGEFYPCKGDEFMETYEQPFGNSFDPAEEFLSTDYNKDTRPHRG